MASIAKHQLLLTFWLVKPEGDLHQVEQMRALGEAGVVEAAFTGGERKLLCMTARFDASDRNARISAALYAVRNAKMIYGALHADASLWGIECWLDGEKLSSNEIPQNDTDRSK